MTRRWSYRQYVLVIQAVYLSLTVPQCRQRNNEGGQQHLDSLQGKEGRTGTVAGLEQ